MAEPVPAGPRREISLFDAVCVVVGVGIYEVPSLVASAVPGPAGVLGVWALGGALSLAGALCYAELAAAYPRDPEPPDGRQGGRTGRRPRRRPAGSTRP